MIQNCVVHIKISDTSYSRFVGCVMCICIRNKRTNKNNTNNYHKEGSILLYDMICRVV